MHTKQNLSFLNLKKRRQASSCVARQANFWTEESCYKKRPYICEFDAVSVRRQVTAASGQQQNKLIRVLCGDLRNKFASVKSADSLPSTTEALPMAASTAQRSMTPPFRGEKTEKPILLWSSLVENFAKEPVAVSTTGKPITFDAYLQGESEGSGEIKSVYEQADGEINSSQAIDSNKAVISQSLVLTIAVVSGCAVVFIVINIFCIWNYYNKKLNAFIEKNDPENSTYRTSTMRSSTRARNNNTTTNNNNNRSLSTVDSYIKIMPYNTVEACLLGSDNSGSTSPSSQTSQRLENELKLELLRNYFQQKQKSCDSNQQNLYETISTTGFQYQPNYLLPNFSVNQDSLNTAVQLLISQQLQEQIYHQVTYSDLSPTLSMNSQRPLLTFNSTNSSQSKQLTTVLDSSATESASSSGSSKPTAI